MTGEALDFETASKMMFGGVKSYYLDDKNANVDSWGGAANAMWSQTGKSLGGNWSFNSEGSHTILAQDKTGNGWADHFVNSLPGGSKLFDGYENTTKNIGDIDYATRGLGRFRILDFDF